MNLSIAGIKYLHVEELQEQLLFLRGRRGARAPGPFAFYEREEVCQSMILLPVFRRIHHRLLGVQTADPL